MRTDFGTNYPEARAMSATNDLDFASGAYRSLENRKKRQLGTSPEAARAALAREFKCAPGTLTNIVKGRAKSVAGWLRDRIEAAALKQLRAEIARLHAEEEAILDGSRPRRDALRDVEEIEADLARLKALMREREA